LPIGIYAELLQDATEAQVKQSVNNPNHVWQEKHNGDRRLIIKQGLDIRDFNRKGDTAKGLTPKLIAALRSHLNPISLLIPNMLEHLMQSMFSMRCKSVTILSLPCLMVRA